MNRIRICTALALIALLAPWAPLLAQTSAPPAPGAPTGPISLALSQSAGYSTMLYSSSSDLPLMAVFDWGDGTPNNSSSIVTPSTSGTQAPSVYHNWVTAGTYYVRAKARDSNGSESGWSGSLAVTVGGEAQNPSGSIPSSPSSLSAAASGSIVSLSWPSVSNATHYNLYRSSYPTNDGWATVCTSPVTSTSCSDVYAVAGTYQYRIEACASGYGCSGTVNSDWEYSNSVAAGTENATVPYLVSSSAATTSVTFNFSEPMRESEARTLSNYQIENPTGNPVAFVESSTVSVSMEDGGKRIVIRGLALNFGTYTVRARNLVSAQGVPLATDASSQGSVSSSDTTVPDTTTPAKQPVTVLLDGGVTVMQQGVVSFVRQGVAAQVTFSNMASVVTELAPGTYEMMASFPGVESDDIVFSGTGVSGHNLTVGDAAGVVIDVKLPTRRAVTITVQNSNGQALADARVEAGGTASGAHASASTDSAGQARLELPWGTYQVRVIRAGYLEKRLELAITATIAGTVVVLEPATLTIQGRVLAQGNGMAEAVVRAQDSDGRVATAKSGVDGSYTLAVRAGTWSLSAASDGYQVGSGGTVTLTAAVTSQTRDIELGAPITRRSSTANLTPTSGGTVQTTELGVRVDLPANALGTTTVQANVTVRESARVVQTTVASPLAATVREITANLAGVPVTDLGSAAAIEFSFSDADLSSLGVTLSDAPKLKLAYWDETLLDWVVLTSVVDVTNRKVRASTTHFTLFAIVLPFLAQPAQAQTPPTEPEPDTQPSGEITDERAAQFAAIVAEGTKVYVSGPESLAAAVGRTRNTSLEQAHLASIVRKVVAAGTPSGIEAAVTNFVTYGTASTLHLGAGERGGVVGSFQSAYGRLPQSEYDWQEVLKIANGRWPGTLLPEREAAMSQTFQRIYLRAPNTKQANDNAALSIMAYGLRSAKRNLSSEAAAINTFKFVFGHSPASSADWDAMRAIAYSGARR